MATLTKANNSFSLTNASAWTPSQVPTAADTLVFDATLGANLNLFVGSGTLYADRLTVGNVSGALTIGPSLVTPVVADALDMTDATANFTLRATMTSPDGGMSVVAKPTRTLFMAPADSDMDVTFPLTAGTPIVSLNAAPSAEGVSNYYASSNSTVTVGATDDAYIVAGGYMAASNQSQLTKIVIPGHPTLPTSVTLKATETGTFGVLSGAGLSNPNDCIAIEIGNDGPIYFGGAWSFVGSSSANYENLFGYDPVAQTVIPIWMGLSSTCYCLRKDTAGNIYIGTVGFLTANFASSGIVRYDPSTGLTTSVGGGYPGSGYALDICPSSTGLVYVGGTATAAADRTAVWNPTTNTWAALGTGCDNTVWALAEDGTGRIWAGGQFTTAGGVAANRLAIWDPATSTWSAATAGATNATQVRSLAYDAVNNRMYVGHNGTTFAGIASPGVIYYDFGTASWVAMACPTSSGRQIRWVAATGRLYLVDGNQSTPIRYWESATNTWNVLANQTGGTLGSLAIDATGTVWAGSISTAFTAPVATNGFIQCSSAGVISSVPFATQQVVTAAASTAFTFRGYAGTNFGVTPILNHVGGTATYTMAPGSGLCLQLLGGGSTAIANGAVVQVRRGGSLLERPTLTAQRGASFRQPNDASLQLSGPVVSLTPTASSGVYSLFSDATRLDLSTAVASGSKYVTLNFKGSELVLGTQATNFTYVTGNFGSANVTVGLNPGANNPNEVYLGYTTTAVPRPLQGGPREMGPVTLGGSIVIESRYFRANNTYVQSPINAGQRIAFGTFSGTNIVEWTSPSDVLLNGFAGLVRVPSFGSFTALGSATHVYSGAGAITVSVPPASTLALATTSGAGALTYNAALSPQTGNQAFNFTLLNTADNKLDADLAPVRGNATNTVRVSGTGTLRVIRDVYATFELTAGNVIFDYSGASASATNMISPTRGITLTAFGGTATFLGKPGAATSQYLFGALTQSVGSVNSGDTTIILSLNGAPSLSLNVASISATQPSNPVSALYIQGLSGSASIRARAATTGLNGMLSWALLTDGFGDANWLASVSTSSNIGSVAYTGALPTSGGAGTENFFLNGAQTQVGNTTGYALKITPTAAGQALDHTGLTLSIVRQFVLCGTAGGDYTIQGTPGSAFQFTPRFIANVSNTELRLVTQLLPALSVATSGTGVVSFGSPATTYVGVDTGTRYLNAVETRIYAGTDNLAPVLTSGTVYVGGNAAVRLSGAGTGRTLAAFLRMQQFSRLTIDDDWTIAGFDATNTSSSIFSEIYIDVPATKTLQMQRWNNTATTPTSVTYATGTVFVKRGAGAFRLLGIPLGRSAGLAMRVEDGSIEIAMDGTYGPWGIAPTCMLLELLAGRPLTLNSSVDHDFPWVIFGAGSVTKQNTNTVYVRSRNSFTGGLTISAGELDAAYRYACGDGNVTVSGGVLRASAVEEDPYALEIAGNLVFSGGSLALGADYVV
jgi:autotransporter-associated beta strand protein